MGECFRSRYGISGIEDLYLDGLALNCRYDIGLNELIQIKLFPSLSAQFLVHNILAS